VRFPRSVIAVLGLLSCGAALAAPTLRPVINASGAWADDLRAGRLVTVLDDWCPEIPGFYLYYPSRKLMPAGLKAFVAMLRGEGA